MNDSFCPNSPVYSFAGDDDVCIVAAVWYGVSGIMALVASFFSDFI